MANRITLSSEQQTTTLPHIENDPWPQMPPHIRKILQKPLGDITSFEIEQLWDSHLECFLTQKVIIEDERYRGLEFGEEISTVNCILTNAETAIATSHGPLNANIVWDFSLQDNPPPITSKEYWFIVEKLKHLMDAPHSEPIISVQLPHEKTRGLYWRMILEKNISTLVSLTNGNDRLKQISVGNTNTFEQIEPIQAHRPADEFWPNLDDEPFVFDKAGIVLKQVPYSGPPLDALPEGLQVLEFKVKELNSSTEKTVRMIRNTKWPDAKDTNIDSLLKIGDILDVIREQAGIAVNCRAGVGRTGTLITFLLLRLMRQRGKPVSLKTIVLMVEVLRKNRNFQMIQKNDQWSLLLCALLQTREQ